MRKGNDPSSCSRAADEIGDRPCITSAQKSNASSLNAAAKLDLLTRIAEKQQQAETALNLALGVNSDGRCFHSDGRRRISRKKPMR